MTTDSDPSAAPPSSRRRLLKAAVAGAGGLAAAGFPAVLRAQTPIKWRIQTAWDAATVGYTAFQRFCANVNSSPRDSTGIERAPSRLSSASPAWSSSTLMDSNSIARTERNSLSFRQLVHPGCQNTFSCTAS